jgi:hypothetical protein
MGMHQTHQHTDWSRAWPGLPFLHLSPSFLLASASTSSLTPSPLSLLALHLNLTSWADIGSRHGYGICVRICMSSIGTEPRHPKLSQALQVLTSCWAPG